MVEDILRAVAKLGSRRINLAVLRIERRRIGVAISRGFEQRPDQTIDDNLNTTKEKIVCPTIVVCLSFVHVRFEDTKALYGYCLVTFASEYSGDQYRFPVPELRLILSARPLR